jgi:ATP-dependent helicase YprA (DUF1998 family)
LGKLAKARCAVPLLIPVSVFQPEKHKVRAIIVYPMNALINSQHKALKTYAENNPDIPIRFDCYTGQEKEEAKKRIQDDPPHILLTNYVMLEYMMLRPTERAFKSGDIREDLDPFDLLRALIGGLQRGDQP